MLPGEDRRRVDDGRGKVLRKAVELVGNLDVVDGSRRIVNIVAVVAPQEEESAQSASRRRNRIDVVLPRRLPVESVNEHGGVLRGAAAGRRHTVGHENLQVVVIISVHPAVERDVGCVVCRVDVDVAVCPNAVRSVVGTGVGVGVGGAVVGRNIEELVLPALGVVAEIPFAGIASIGQYPSRILHGVLEIAEIGVGRQGEEGGHVAPDEVGGVAAVLPHFPNVVGVRRQAGEHQEGVLDGDFREGGVYGLAVGDGEQAVRAGHSSHPGKRDCVGGQGT